MGKKGFGYIYLNFKFTDSVIRSVTGEVSLADLSIYWTSKWNSRHSIAVNWQTGNFLTSEGYWEMPNSSCVNTLKEHTMEVSAKGLLLKAIFIIFGSCCKLFCDN